MSRDVLLRYGWSEKHTLEDVELGVRIVSDGGIVVPVNATLYLEVPSSYEDFKTQQYRWANGVGLIIRDHIVKLWTSKNVGLRVKIDTTLYLLQCASPLSQLILNIICLLMILTGLTSIIEPFILALLVLSHIFVAPFIHYCRVFEHLPYTLAFRILGRTAALTSAMSFDLTYSFIRGLLGRRCYWRVTGKGIFKPSSIRCFRGELVQLIISSIGFILSITSGLYIVSLWYLLQLLPILYLAQNVIRGKM